MSPTEPAQPVPPLRGVPPEKIAAPWSDVPAGVRTEPGDRLVYSGARDVGRRAR